MTSISMIDDKINMVIRQTNYSYDEIKEKLKMNTPLEIIRDYMNITDKKEVVVDKSNNQQRFTEIRNFMNKVSCKKIQR